ncbi:MAG: hypothetical protein JWL77_2950 [Chthonomonadaceae bacterium]|nr:hypothetical protein [Chthonomonadaceae bacterium]
MKERRLSRTAIATRIVMLLLLGTFGLWLRAQLHQYDLNHDLLAGLLDAFSQRCGTQGIIVER